MENELIYKLNLELSSGTEWNRFLNYKREKIPPILPSNARIRGGVVGAADGGRAGSGRRATDAGHGGLGTGSVNEVAGDRL